VKYFTVRNDDLVYMSVHATHFLGHVTSTCNVHLLFTLGQGSMQIADFEQHLCDPKVGLRKCVIKSMFLSSLFSQRFVVNFQQANSFSLVVKWQNIAQKYFNHKINGLILFCDPLK